MAKNVKRFFSMLLALSMVFSLVLPAAATETGAHDHAEEAKQEETINMESVLESITVNAENIELEVDYKNKIVLADPNTEVDEDDPAIIAFETDLKAIKVWDDAAQQPVPLTEDQIREVLGLYQQYLDYQEANADTLGLQTPFFLSYNDEGEDGLGVLGEMLALANVSVDAVRAGYMTMDDLTGMILNFYYGDQLGVQYYGAAIESARDEVLGLIEASGAQTEIQKLLVLNDWLAHINTFDMPYIMNSGKENPPMVAKNPVKHEHYDGVLATMTKVYEEILTNTFVTQIKDGLEAEFKKQYYTEAIKNVIYQGGLAQARENEDLVNALKAQLGWDAAYAEALEAEEKKVYDEAYNEYLNNNHEHEVKVTFGWEEVKAEDGTTVIGWTCEEAEVSCSVEGCTAELTAEVELETETTDAQCDVAGKTVYTATATVTDAEGTQVGEPVVDTKEVVIEALGHDFVDGKCSRCDEPDPDVTEPTEPEVTEPEVTEPEVTEPEVTEPEVTEPEVTEPEVTEPEVTEPEVTEPEVTEPEVTEPEVTEPEATEPEATEASSASAIPDAFNFWNQESPAVVAEEGEGEGETSGEGENPGTGEGAETDPTVDPEADAYAKQAVADKKDEIEAAAKAAADEKTGLNAAIEQYVTGGTEDVDTDIEKEIWAEAEGFVAQEEVAAALAEDPAGYVDSQEMFQQMVPVTGPDGNYVIGEDGQPVMMTLAQQLHMGWDQFWADAQENGIEVDPVNAPGYKMTVDQIVEQQMNTPMADLPQAYDENGNPKVDEEGNPVHMTPNEAVPVFAAQAAEGLTDGIINYWEGSHFGALGMGTSVCLGYTKAFTYLVQCMHPEIYGVNGAGTDMSKAENWKKRNDVYVYDENGNIDINQNYVVDAVRVTFDASVTMYGQTEDNFNSDHFWNAVKIDGNWYYADPCYTDVFTEVMMRDRVETDGQMNHLYFIFSHTAAVEMYDGNYKEIKSLYEDVATGRDFEDSWISRIKSNTYFDDGYAYYMYDSTDMLTMMEEYENQNQNSEADFDDPVYKIVRHKLDADDTGDGDKDYETLIVFNYTEDDDSEAVATVYDPEVKATVDNELLTELWSKHAAYAEVYPSIMITAAYHNGKIYFNLANCILSYDVATSAVEVVKEYNTIQGKRDNTKPFGGMAFSVVSDGGDFTVENRPIAGMTIKNDGNMYVSVATNFAFISGKSDRCDPASEGYGYEYEESNFNDDYNSYMDFGDYDDDELASYGYTREVNDNDEFMWTANFVEKLSMSHLAGSHNYETVSVDATCGIDAFTENRCADCGAIEADSRVYEEGTACEHHYVEFYEQFYTKDDAGRWNDGTCYVCTECGYAVTEPKEPTGQMAEQEGAMEEYEEAKAIYDAAKASAGHTYVPSGETWAEDNSTVTFSTMECSAVCPERKPYLDCLLNDDTISITLEEAITAEAVKTTVGICTEGLTEIYTATGEVEVNGEMLAYTVTKEIVLEPADCNYVDGVCTVCGDSTVKRVYGQDRIGTALAVAAALKDTLGVDKFDSIILAAGCTSDDQNKFADALSGNYLANVKKAPVLLYTKGDLSPKNLAFIEENLSENGTVYLLGGNVSIPAEVEEELKTAGYTTKRLGGDDRYHTNLIILGEAGVDAAEEILIAGGQAFADSLSASATGLPIMLVNGTKTELTDAQIEYLKGLEGKKFTILGGNAAVSAELEAAIEEVVGVEVDRVFGETREETSVKIAKRYFADAEFALIAYSRMYPDGLAGGVLANTLRAPLLLTKAGSETITNTYIEESGIEAGYVLGGTAVMTDETAKAVFGLAENAIIRNAYYTE